MNDERLLRRQLGQLVHVGDDADGHAARVDEVDADPAQALRAAAASVRRWRRPAAARRPRRRARNAGPTNRDRGPRRISTHGAPASVPRSCSSSGGAQTVLKPKARANASARSRSGFSNSSHARSCTLMTGLRDRPGVLPGQRALLAVQVVVGADGVAHAEPPFRTDEIVTYDETISQDVSDEILKTDISLLPWGREPNRQTSPSTGWSGANSAPAPR